jgi:hypothetical protein
MGITVRFRLLILIEFSRNRPGLLPATVAVHSVKGDYAGKFILTGFFDKSASSVNCRLCIARDRTGHRNSGAYSWIADYCTISPGSFVFCVSCALLLHANNLR